MTIKNEMVSVPRELMERWADKLEGSDSAGYGWEDLLSAEMRAILAQPVRGPSRWTDSELADGKRGIRWITEDGVYGRPTGHDVRVYLEANGEMLACECVDCVKFYAAPQPGQSGLVEALEGAVHLMDLMQDDIDSLIGYAGGTGGFGEYRDRINGISDALSAQGDE